MTCMTARRFLLLVLLALVHSQQAQAGFFDSLARMLGLNRRTPVRVPVVVENTSRQESKPLSPATGLRQPSKPTRQRVVAKAPDTSTTALDMLTDPRYFWYPANIYYGSLFPQGAYAPFTIPDELMQDIERSQHDPHFLEQVKAFRAEMRVEGYFVGLAVEALPSANAATDNPSDAPDLSTAKSDSSETRSSATSEDSEMKIEMIPSTIEPPTKSEGSVIESIPSRTSEESDMTIEMIPSKSTIEPVPESRVEPSEPTATYESSNHNSPSSYDSSPSSYDSGSSSSGCDSNF